MHYLSTDRCVCVCVWSYRKRLVCLIKSRKMFTNKRSVLLLSFQDLFFFFLKSKAKKYCISNYSWQDLFWTRKCSKIRKQWKVHKCTFLFSIYLPYVLYFLLQGDIHWFWFWLILWCHIQSSFILLFALLLSFTERMEGQGGEKTMHQIARGRESPPDFILSFLEQNYWPSKPTHYEDSSQ